MDKSLAARLREAVSSGEFQRASEFWNAYVVESKAELRRGSTERLPQMHELIEWTRGVVTCARAQSLRRLRMRLTELHAAGVYDRISR